MKKIKEKRLFGEKHRLRRQQRTKRNEQLLARKKQFNEEYDRRFEESKQEHREFLAKHREFLANQLWYQRILTLNPGDPCEFYQRPDWHPAIFVQHVVEPDGDRTWWRVRDVLQGVGLRVRHIRSPGDQDAFPGLNASYSGLLQEIEQTINRTYAKLGESRPVMEDVVPDLEVGAQAVP